MGQKSSRPRHSFEVEPKLHRNASELNIPRERERNIKFTKQFPSIDDSLTVPQWIHKSQFIEILKENVSEFSNIENFFIEPALSDGENYSSLMLRISIDVKLTGE